MKKIIALVLVLCMSFGMIVSVSAASPFIQRFNLARLIRSMFASDENDYGFGEVKDGIFTVYVAPNGKKNADGTEKNPKFCVGPTSLRPGPILFRAANTEVKVVEKSWLSMDSISIETK